MRYSGMIGYAEQAEVSPGVWEDVITERSYIGDVVQRTERLDSADSVIPQVHTTTSFSVLSDGVLQENYSNIRYVTYMGTRWAVDTVIFKFPRIEIYVGEEYHGPTP